MPAPIVLEPRGPFDLGQAIGFGFGPRQAQDGRIMRLAFATDGDGAPAGVVLGQGEPGGTVSGAIHGDADPERVTAQVARILSLDVDAAPWEDLGDREPLLGGLQERFPGLRPVLFHSPYEAACWAVVSTRWGRDQARRARDAIAAAHGHTFKLAGEVLSAWPAPARLRTALDEERVLGLPGEKLRRLRGVAEAAVAGELDAARLHALGPERAEDAVGELRGFGPFYRSLVVVRAVGFTDALAADEPASRRAAAQLHGMDALDADGFAALAERWRPFRTWATVLLRVAAQHDGLI